MGLVGAFHYCVCTPVVDVQYERDSNTVLIETIVDALAMAEGVETTNLPPLYETIDPDLIDQFVCGGENVSTEAVLSFQFDTWVVFVHADGKIRVCDATRPTDPKPVFEEFGSCPGPA